MAKVLTDNKHYQNIANKIRELAIHYYYDPEYQDDYYMKPEDMPQGIQNVYYSGELSGESYGYQWGKEDVIALHDDFKTITGTEFYLNDISELDGGIEITANDLQEKQELRFTVCGNNFAPLYGTTILNPNHTFRFPVSLPSGTYTLSGEFITKSQSGKMKIVGYGLENEWEEIFSHTFAPPASGRYSFTITVLERLKSIKFFCSDDGTYYQASVTDFQVNKGSKALPFEVFTGSENVIMTKDFSTYYTSCVYPTSTNTNIFAETTNYSSNPTLTISYRQSKGVKNTYDGFWDVYQDNGNRVSYPCGFGGQGWNDDTFKPKYDMYPTDSYMMFRSSGITDLRNLPVKLDFSKTGNTQYMFQWAGVKYIGELDVRNAKTQTTSMLGYVTGLISVDLLKVNENNAFSGWFAGCGNLENLIVEGTIAKSGFDISPCKKLNRASIESIVNALSTTTTGLSVSFSSVAKEAAFTQDEWEALIGTKPNWIFNLV